MKNIFVHYNTPHSYKYFILYRATVHNGVMPYRNAIAYGSGVCLISSVNHYTVLDIGVIAYANAIHIAANNRIIPHCTAIA